MSESLPVITVKRSEWGRGKFPGKLYDSKTGLRCCLGFVCKAAGFADDVLDGLKTVDEIFVRLPDTKVPRLLEGLVATEKPVVTILHNILTNINDHAKADAEREAELIKEARQAGFEFCFVD